MIWIVAALLVYSWAACLRTPRKTDDDLPALTPEETLRMERILARCEAERICLVGLDPMVVDEWLAYLETHNHVLIVANAGLAAAVSTPKPERIH